MLGLSVLLFLISLLTVLKAPMKPLWFVALGATEWGHWMAIGSLLFAFWNWRKGPRWDAASGWALMAAGLYLTPLGRAAVVARQLPRGLASSFGNALPQESLRAPARLTPLAFTDLFKGVRSPNVRVKTMVYTTINGKPLSLDLYAPLTLPSPRGEGRVARGVRGLPAVIVVHGGSWQSGERGEFPDLSRYLAARGYIVASIDYRLAPGAVFPAQEEDVFSAIAYLKNHAQTIGLDKTRIVLLGRSAGGQIALSAAYAQKEPAIKGVIVFYAPNDLEWGYSIVGNPLIINSQKVIATYLGGTPEQVPGKYQAASPLHFVNKNTLPTLMIHGVRDELVWAQHEERLSKRLTEAGRPYFYLRLPWATHGCDANFSGPCGQLSAYAVERFLATVTSPPL